MKKERIIGIFVLFIMIFALVPLYIISDYAHPSVDDYSYGTFASQVWQATGSIPKVLANAWQRTAHTYQTWQGTFSSIFLMRLSPFVFGEEYYFLTTAVLLTAFMIGSILLYLAIFTKLFHATFIQGWILSGILSLGALEFTHVISDSFYWYNGGITYTFFYFMETFLFAMLIFLYCAKKNIVKILLGIGSFILAFFTCGGNYVTSLVTVEILFFLCVFVFLREYHIKGIGYRFFGTVKSEEKKSHKIDVYFFVFVFFAAMAGFLTAVLAPGNAVRQAEVGKTMNPIAAVLLSFVYGIYSIGNCINLPVIILFFSCIPLMAVISKKSNYSFRYSGVVTFLSYCLYSSQITPVIYAQGIKIPYRIMNIIYFSCFVMIAVNLFYWIGYFGTKEKTKSIIEKIILWYKKYLLHFYSICFLIFCFTAVGNISIEADVDLKGATQIEVREMPASISALYSLINGEAKQYDKEAWERYQVYCDKSIEHVVVSEFSVKPKIIFHSDITENPRNWKNKCVKKYFKKKSVKLKKTKNKK